MTPFELPAELDSVAHALFPNKSFIVVLHDAYMNCRLQYNYATESQMVEELKVLTSEVFLKPIDTNTKDTVFRYTILSVHEIKNVEIDKSRIETLLNHPKLSLPAEG